MKREIDALKTNIDITDYKAKLTQQLTKLASQYSSEKEESSVGLEHIHQWEKEVRELGSELQDNIDKAIKNLIYSKCSEIIERYRDFINDLNSGEELSISGYDLKKKITFPQMTANDMNEVITKWTEAVTENKKEKGLFAMIKRFLGKGGYEQVKVGEIEYINVKEYIKNTGSKIREHAILEWEKKIEEANKCVAQLKNLSKEKLVDIDNQVIDALAEMNDRMKEKDKMEERVKKNKKNTEWLSQYVKEIDEILEV